MKQLPTTTKPKATPTPKIVVRHVSKNGKLYRRSYSIDTSPNR